MKGISLPAVLQVIDLERQSCSVQANKDGRSGSLHFRDGTLVHALTGDLVGEEAAFEILAWNEPEYHVDTKAFSGDVTLSANIHHILRESARRQDEEQHAASGEAPAPSGNGSAAAGNGSAPSGNGGAPTGPAPAATVPSMATTAAAPAAYAPAATAGPVSTPTPEATPPAAGAAPRSMDAAALQRMLTSAQGALGDALQSFDIVLRADGTSVVAYQSSPAASAFLSQLTAQVQQALCKIGLAGLGRYYMAEIAGDGVLLVAISDTCQLCMSVDITRVQMGMLLNVILPDLLAQLNEACAGTQRAAP